MSHLLMCFPACVAKYAQVPRSADRLQSASARTASSSGYVTGVAVGSRPKSPAPVISWGLEVGGKVDVRPGS